MKIKWSAIGVTNASGTSGGTVFSHNRGGSYARRWAKPVNAQTARQGAMRSLFGAVAQTWGKLTTAQVNAWAAAGANITVTNGFGDSHNMTGNTYFMRCNQNRTHGMGLPITLEPLPLIILPNVNFVEHIIGLNSGAALSTAIQLNLENGEAGTAITASIGIAVVSPSQNRDFGSMKNKFNDRIRRTVVMDSLGNGSISISNQDPDLLAIVGAAANGSTVFLQVHTHSQAGQKSNPVTFRQRLVNDPVYTVTSDTTSGSSVEGGDTLSFRVFKDGILVDPAELSLVISPTSYGGPTSTVDGSITVVVADAQEAGPFEVMVINEDSDSVGNYTYIYQV